MPKNPKNLMWVIEDRDEAGDGLFICLAKNRKEALNKWTERQKLTSEVISCEACEFIELALFTREDGASGYAKESFKPVAGNSSYTPGMKWPFGCRPLGGVRFIENRHLPSATVSCSPDVLKLLEAEVQKKNAG